mgnify:CR=1 FL=1|jgi:hypothetical protein
MDIPAILGALFLLLGVAAIRGATRGVFTLALAAVVFGIAAVSDVYPWPGVYVVLGGSIVLGTKETPMVASPEERDRRKALMEKQDKLADELFRRASSSGEFRRP